MAMRFGLTTFPTDYGVHPSDLARACEEHGFESLFVPEHTHIPTSRESPYPFDSDAPLPTEFSHLLDPFIALAVAGAATERLMLGVGLCVVPHHDPIILAKVVSSLDHVSRGRVILGVGAGWNDEELRNHGGEGRHRWSVLRERVLAMRELWTRDDAEFHGEFVDFDPVWQWPKPHQRPYPQVLVGGRGPRVFERVIDYGDGWLASGKHEHDERLAGRIARFRNAVEEAGRPRLPVTLQQGTKTPAMIEAYQEMGLDRCTFRLPPGDASEVFVEIARLERLVAPYRVDTTEDASP